MKRGAAVLAVLVIAAGAVPPAARAQQYSSAGVGMVRPLGDFGDTRDAGWTVRGEVGASLVGIIEAHAQVGWSGFPRVPGPEEDADDHIVHAGIGTRLGLGLTFLGLNLLWFTDDGAGAVWVPEAGARLGPLELVADLRPTGNQTWIALRAGVRF
ncbi:MAG: hypothetical protein R3E98_09755 [Gemmatimonadota bacterium]